MNLILTVACWPHCETWLPKTCFCTAWKVSKLLLNCYSTLWRQVFRNNVRKLSGNSLQTVCKCCMLGSVVSSLNAVFSLFTTYNVRYLQNISIKNKYYIYMHVLQYKQ